jgi:hypothetical protein
MKKTIELFRKAFEITFFIKIDSFDSFDRDDGFHSSIGLFVSTNGNHIYFATNWSLRCK